MNIFTASIIVLLGVGVIYIVYLLVNAVLVARHNAQTTFESYLRDVAIVKSIPYEKAKLLAYSLISNETMFEVEKWNLNVLSSSILSCAISDLSHDYMRIKIIGTDFIIDFSNLHEWEADNRFVVIGIESEHTDIVFHPGEETVYTLYEGGASEDDLLAEGNPSLYHLLIIKARLFFEISLDGYGDNG